MTHSSGSLLVVGSVLGFSVWRVLVVGSVLGFSFWHVHPQPHIAATTFVNTEQMFEDIHCRQELTKKDYFLIIPITDGCAGQYKSGTAMYVLAMHAQVTGKIFFQVVKCAGHGKCCCNADGGCHKTFCDKFFDRHIIIPKQATDGSRGVPSHKVQDGRLVSLAETVCRILNDKDYVHGALSKSNRKNKDALKVISERRFILRKKGACNNMLGVKMEAYGFEKVKHMGL